MSVARRVMLGLAGAATLAVLARDAIAQQPDRGVVGGLPRQMSPAQGLAAARALRMRTQGELPGGLSRNGSREGMARAHRSGAREESRGSSRGGGGGGKPYVMTNE